MAQKETNLSTLFGPPYMFFFQQNLTKTMIVNKFKNARRGDKSEEVMSKKRMRTSLLNYLPKDVEGSDAGELRHKMREGQLQGMEVSSMAQHFYSRDFAAPHR